MQVDLCTIYPDECKYAGYTSSRPEVILLKRCCQKFHKIHRKTPVSTGKHLCQRVFLNKIAGLNPETLLKRLSGTGVFL